jgi:hypothetical protein
MNPNGSKAVAKRTLEPNKHEQYQLDAITKAPVLKIGLGGKSDQSTACDDGPGTGSRSTC